MLGGLDDARELVGAHGAHAEARATRRDAHLFAGLLDVDSTGFERADDVVGEPRRHHGHAVARARDFLRHAHGQLAIGGRQLEVVPDELDAHP